MSNLLKSKNTNLKINSALIIHKLQNTSTRLLNIQIANQTWSLTIKANFQVIMYVIEKTLTFTLGS